MAGDVAARVMADARAAGGGQLVEPVDRVGDVGIGLAEA